MTATATYEQPAAVSEAVAMLDDAGTAATIVAGGTDVLVGARSGKHAFPDRVVSIHALDELRYTETAPDGAVRIGALVSHDTIEHSELMRRGHLAALADASALVGSPATRNLGTLGGNICNGSPAMDTGGPLLVLDTTISLEGASGRRSLPVAEFVRGPGRVAREPGELAVGFEIPAPAAGRWGSAYERLGYRRAMEIAVVGATAAVRVDDAGAVADARICLTAVAPTCVRVPDLEAALVGVRQSADALALVNEARFDEAAPIGDVRASAGYRERMVRVIVRRALARALDRAGVGR